MSVSFTVPSNFYGLDAGNILPTQTLASIGESWDCSGETKIGATTSPLHPYGLRPLALSNGWSAEYFSDHAGRYVPSFSGVACRAAGEVDVDIDFEPLGLDELV
tara:strand:- start:1390 stop:1701 length:312 start_codon:yes stop_codon:yes gene_type:complete